ncbi:MAG: hypothetical protein AB8C95_12580, partial [Phycisphaeraceae bacterium]
MRHLLIVLLTLFIISGCKSAEHNADSSTAVEVDIEAKIARLDKAFQRRQEVQDAFELGIASDVVLDRVGKPSSIEKQPVQSIPEVWRYDIDTGVYCLINFDNEGYVIGTFSSAFDDLMAELGID